MPTTITKPWGKEIILTTDNLPYAAKILSIKTGHRFSLQSHDQKIETLTLIKGQAQITLGQNKDSLSSQEMKPQSGYTIQPHTLHRIKAITDCQIFEASTPEKGTTKRIEDDYNRPDETEKDRNSTKQKWQ